MIASNEEVEREHYAETKMTSHRKTKHVHAGKHVGEVDVEVVEDETTWSPYLSAADAGKLDFVRTTLRRGDIKSAAAQSRVYNLQPAGE